ncbi:MAG: hypothetical protein AAGF35_10715 [Pseudomonadota bacterium]
MRYLAQLVLAVTLLSPGISLACTCSAPPILSQSAINATLLTAQVIRYVEGDEGYNDAMVLKPTRLFRGDVEDELITVKGGGPLTCSSMVDRFPIGSEWLFILTSYREGELSVAGCYPEIEVVSGSIEGYIRNNTCNGDYFPGDCPRLLQSMTLDEFDVMQEIYFHGATDAVRGCVENRLKQCPRAKSTFSFEDNTLRIPYIGVYRTTNGLSTRNPRPPLGVFNATFTLVEGRDGELTFRIDYLDLLSAP